jgi:homoserine O-acetyltransferase
MQRVSLLILAAMASILLPSLTQGGAAAAASFPTPKQGAWIARDFQFRSGEVLPELKLHYRTLGDPSHPAVLVLHGTGGSGASLLTPAFAGELFGPGQPLDATRHFIILPDAIGHGASSKPSDGLRMRFPQYDSEDMVVAQHRLLTEGLGVKHLRLVIGNSMGGMHTWLWAQMYPDFMDAAVPMAAQPARMSGRNWIMRRMVIEMIKADPTWQGGAYMDQPPSLDIARVFYALATSGGTLAYQAQAPDSASGDRLVEERLAAPPGGDANDTIYHLASSKDYNPEPGLERITAPVLAIAAADDERNPLETGIMDAQLKRVGSATLFLIPASSETRGHGTTGAASFYAERLRTFLDQAPVRGGRQ